MSVTAHNLRLDDPHGKRAQILQAARALFMAGGYGPTSMEAVAREAGVSKATLYAYFESKDALFNQIVAESCTQAREENSLAAEALGGDVRAALMAIGGRLLRFFLRPSTLAVHRMVIAESVRFPELGEAFYAAGPQAGIAWMAGFLADQASRGALVVENPERAAEQFGALLRGVLFMRALLGQTAAEPGEAEIDGCVAAAVETFMRAYGPAAAPG